MQDKINKIAIFGRSGSGKSTFSVTLAARLGIKAHHLDRWFFTQNWAKRDGQEFIDIQRSLIAHDKWIIDGNCLRTLELRFSEADLVLYFCYPRWLSYYRIFKRLFTRHPAIQDRADGCGEKVSWDLLTYTWNFEDRVKERLGNLPERYPNVRFITVRNDKELTKLVDQLWGTV